MTQTAQSTACLVTSYQIFGKKSQVETGGSPRLGPPPCGSSETEKRGENKGRRSSLQRQEPWSLFRPPPLLLQSGAGRRRRKTAQQSAPPLAGNTRPISPPPPRPASSFFREIQTLPPIALGPARPTSPQIGRLSKRTLLLLLLLLLLSQPRSTRTQPWKALDRKPPWLFFLC